MKASLLLLTLVACPPVGEPSAEEARTVEVIAEDYVFRPDTINAEPGEALRVVLVNQGTVPHNIEFELPSEEYMLEEDLQRGDTGELLFYAPQDSGTYTYYCPVNGHADYGMAGTLVVGDGGDGGPF